MERKLPSTIRELRTSSRFRRHLLAAVLCIAVLAYLGPFGTAERMSPGRTAVYWACAIGFNWLIAMAIIPVSIRTLDRAGRQRWMGTVFGALVAAFPGTGVVLLLEAVFTTPVGLGVTIIYVYSCVALVFLVLGFLVSQLVEKPLREGETTGEATVPSPFLRRLPDRLGKDLLHLRMQDHYVEAHTAKGSDLILLRFRDALREVEGLDGIQVHRSHWVARAAVAGTLRRKGRIFLELANGSEVPVSRSFLPELRSRGWLP